MNRSIASMNQSPLKLKPKPLPQFDRAVHKNKNKNNNNNNNVEDAAAKMEISPPIVTKKKKRALLKQIDSLPNKKKNSNNNNNNNNSSNRTSLNENENENDWDLWAPPKKRARFLDRVSSLKPKESLILLASSAAPGSQPHRDSSVLELEHECLTTTTKLSSSPKSQIPSENNDNDDDSIGIDDWRPPMTNSNPTMAPALTHLTFLSKNAIQLQIQLQPASVASRPQEEEAADDFSSSSSSSSPSSSHDDEASMMEAHHDPRSVPRQPSRRHEDDHPEDPSIPEWTSFSSPSSTTSTSTSTQPPRTTACTPSKSRPPAGPPVVSSVQVQVQIQVPPPSHGLPQVRLDETLSCSKCEASHRHYLMYQKLKQCPPAPAPASASASASRPRETNRRSTRLLQENNSIPTPTLEFLCSICWEQQQQQQQQTDDEDGDGAHHEEHTDSSFSSSTESSFGSSPTTITTPPLETTTTTTTTTTTLLLQYLDSVENELELCAISIDHAFLESLECQVRNELIDGLLLVRKRKEGRLSEHGNDNDNDNYDDEQQLKWLMTTNVQEIECLVLEEMDSFQDQWQQHYDLVQCTRNVLVQQLQKVPTPSVQHAEASTSASVSASGDDLNDVVLAYYHWRNRNLFYNDDENHNHNNNYNNSNIPRWKLLADQALDLRDKQLGLGPGHFWGAQGYQAPDPSVYNLPDDFMTIYDLVDYDDTLTTETVFPAPLPPTRGLGWNSMARGQIDPIVARQMVEDAYDQGDLGLHLNGRLEVWTEALDILVDESSYYESSHDTRHGMVHLTLDTVHADLAYLAPPRKIPTITNISSTTALVVASRRSTNVPRAAATTTTSTTLRRAPRTCQRCKQFGGANATTCSGSKARFGSKACDNFTETGKERTKK